MFTPPQKESNNVQTDPDLKTQCPEPCALLLTFVNFSIIANYVILDERRPIERPSLVWA